jgi:K+-sensing histidine kinase KdpD
VLLLCAALLLRFLLHKFFVAQDSFLPFVIAVAGSVWLHGTTIAIVVAIVGGFSELVFFRVSLGELDFDPLTLIGSSLYAITSAVIIIGGQRLQRLFMQQQDTRSVAERREGRFSHYV